MMKNTLLAALILFVLGNLCRFGLPWWWLGPMAALVGWWVPKSGFGAFFAGFLGGFVLWLSAAWQADSSNGGALSAKVGQLFMGLEGQQLLWATGILGGLVAAFFALTGFWGKGMIQAPARRRSYMQERRR